MSTQLDFVVVASGRVLDTVTLAGEGPPRYRTGAARGTVEQVERTGGRAALDGWTNGYVALRAPGAGR